MLNERILNSIIADLNTSASMEWREDRHMELMSFKEHEDEVYQVEIMMGKDNPTTYTITFAPDGYEYTMVGDGSNVGDMEGIMQMLMDQYDSPHYFVLDQIEDDKWKLTDEANGISVTWEVCKFNETQQFDTSGFDLQQYGMESARIIATITSRMADWLADNYRELVEELTPRQRWALLLARLRKSQGITIRELADKCGYSATTIVNIEQCKFSPRIEVVDTILQSLGYRLTITPDVSADEDFDDFDED